jgi:signal transduction histidine kinase
LRQNADLRVYRLEPFAIVDEQEPEDSAVANGRELPVTAPEREFVRTVADSDGSIAHFPGFIYDLIFNLSDMPEGTRAGFRYHAPGARGYPDSFTGISLVFINDPVALPNYSLRLTTDLSEAIRYFLIGFAVLLAIELWMIISGIFSARKSAGRILQPISELTRAAQSIKTEPELKLAGAIDTLNTITEEHLDKRISIVDEREELRGLAGAINNMLDRLDAAYKAQLRFVSDASHELRTPISVIQGYANLLDRWGKNDEKTLQESIDAIKNEAEGMKNLVEQLLFLARSDNDTIVFTAETVDLAEIALEVEYETRMIDDSHVFTSDIEANLPVFGDRQLLKRALRIFVDNSLKYTPDGGEIKIAARRQDDLVLLSVTDTGIGIPDEDIANVFERFFRADESRARKFGGTGLGLSIARWIVERSGGYLEITSRTDIGTKITAVFPIKNVVGQATVPGRPQAINMPDNG